MATLYVNLAVSVEALPDFVDDVRLLTPLDVGVPQIRIRLPPTLLADLGVATARRLPNVVAALDDVELANMIKSGFKSWFNKHSASMVSAMSPRSA